MNESRRVGLRVLQEPTYRRHFYFHRSSLAIFHCLLPAILPTSSVDLRVLLATLSSSATSYSPSLPFSLLSIVVLSCAMHPRRFFLQKKLVPISRDSSQTPVFPSTRDLIPDYREDVFRGYFEIFEIQYAAFSLFSFSFARSFCAFLSSTLKAENRRAVNASRQLTTREK